MTSVGPVNTFAALLDHVLAQMGAQFILVFPLSPHSTAKQVPLVQFGKTPPDPSFPRRV